MLSPRRRILFALGLLCVLAGLPSALAAEPDKPRLDATGEPLPAEAVQRLGSLSFRTEMYGGVALSPDGKTIAMATSTGLALIDPATGKERKRFDIPGLVGNGLSYSPSGKTIAAMTNVQQGVQLLDAESGNVQGKLDAVFHAGNTSISFSADGKRIAVGASNFNGKLDAAVWDGDSFKKLHSLEVLQDYQVQVSLSGDGKQLATWGQHLNRGVGGRNTEIPRTIQLWDTVTGKELKKIVAEGNYVIGAALSPDGKVLAVADGAGSSISIWDVETAKVLHRLAARRGSGSILRYSPDGKVLVAGTSDGAVQLWETPEYTRLGMAQVANCTLTSIAFLPEKKVLALGLSGQALRVWEAPSGRILSPLEGHTASITTLRFSPDGKKVLSGGQDGVHVWDAAAGKSERHALLQDLSDPIRIHGMPQQYLLSPDGRTVITSVQHIGNPRVMDLVTEQEQYSLNTLINHTGLSAAFSADGKIMAAVTTVATPAQGPGVRIWNLASGREGVVVSLAPGQQYAVALSADGKLVAAVSNSYNRGGRPGQTAELTLWDTATGKERWTSTRDNQFMTHLAFSPSGDLIATAGATSLRLLDAATGTELRPPENMDGMQVGALAFSPDGRTLAIGGSNRTGQTQTGTVRLWETATARLRVEFSGHRSYVGALAFSPDGRVLASGSNDTTILLWDLTGKLNADVRSAAKPKPAEFDALWNDLNDTDAAKSYRLVQRLAAYPEEAVALVKAKLPPTKSKPLDAATIDKMIAQLDHDDFARREDASKFLAEAGKAVEPALTKALEAQPPPEKKRRLMELLEALKVVGPTVDMVRPTRALELLERVGTPEARQLLAELEKGDAGAKLTQDARATLKRLGSTKP